MADKDWDAAVLPSRHRNELQKFALQFHQDWDLVFPDFLQGTAMYLQRIPPTRRMQLKIELGQFMMENENASAADLRSRWVKLGAEAWQPNLDIREGLGEILAMM